MIRVGSGARTIIENILMGAFFISTTSAVAKAQCPAANAVYRDPTHPCEFLQIREIDRTGKTHRVFGPSSDGSREETGVAVVDKASTIHISIAPPDSLRGSFTLGLDAFLRQGDKDQPLNVPGYSVVGQNISVTTVKVIEAGEILSLLQILSEFQDTIKTALSSTKQMQGKAMALRTEAVQATAAHDKADAVLLQLVADSATTADRMTAIHLKQLAPTTTSADSTRLAQPASDSVRMLQKSDSLMEIALKGNLAAIILKISGTRALAIQTQQVAYRTGQTQQLIDFATTDEIEHLIAVIHYANQARTVIKYLADTVNRTDLEIIGRMTHQPRMLIGEDVNAVQAAYTVIDSIANARQSTDTSQKRTAVKRFAQNLKDALDRLTVNISLYSPNNPAYLAVVSSLLPSTDIVLSMTAASPGDRLIIRATVEANDRSRRFDIPIAIAQYGLVSGFSDSFAFIQRQVPTGLDANVLRSRANAYLGKSSFERALLSNSVDVPVRDNPSAAAGVTLGVTWKPRPSSWHNLTQQLGSLLHPGIGLNGSFLSFATRTYHLTPPLDTATSISMAAIDGSPVDKRQDLALGAGLIFSLFDNAVSYTRGWLVTASSYRSYWGVGFSFVGLTNAGKDFYQKLARGQ